MMADATIPQSWVDLYRSLPYLRQSLSCSVCGEIVRQPMGPTHTVCQHNVCKQCVGGKMRLKPSCSWCKEYHLFRENTQLRILVQCFKQLCQYIYRTPIKSRLSSSANGETNTLLSIIEEARHFEDDYKPHSPLSSFRPLPLLCHYAVPHSGDKFIEHACASTSNESANSTTSDNDVASSDNRACTNSKRKLYVAKMKKSKYKQRRNLSSQLLNVKTNGDKILSVKQELVKHHLNECNFPQMNDIENRCEPIAKRIRGEAPALSHRRVCSCGKVHQGRLTCFGQRCPCYSMKQDCRDCNCQNCRNPITATDANTRSIGEADPLTV